MWISIILYIMIIAVVLLWNHAANMNSHREDEAYKAHLTQKKEKPQHTSEK